MTVSINEAELVRRAQAKDMEAFEVLVNLHQRYVYNLALRVLADEQEAWDIAQETFVRAWLALKGFRGQSQFRTWLFRIATNLCYNRLPGLRRQLSALGEDCLMELPADPQQDPGPHGSMEMQEQRVFLHRKIEELPESQRLLVVLRYQEELSYEEIANVLNLPLGTIKTGLFRAKERLKESFRTYSEVLP
jgi:RNA polymerase sigma-70 factor, ECF subfamily